MRIMTAILILTAAVAFGQGIVMQQATTNTWIVTNEQDLVALPVATNAFTNALQAMAEAMLRATPSQASSICENAIAEWSPAGSVNYATEAGSLVDGAAQVKVSVTPDGMTVIRMTNTTSVIVTHESASNNGPPVGTIWSNPAWGGVDWAWGNIDHNGGWAVLNLSNGDDANVMTPGVFTISTTGTGSDGAWTFSSGGDLPMTLSELSGASTGTMSIAWLTATNYSLSFPWAVVTGAVVNGKSASVTNGTAYLTLEPTDIGAMASSTNFVVTVSNGLTWIDAGASTGFVFRFTYAGGTTNVYLP